ncbi:MAG: hypothetical protein ABI443_01305 [Chthoniobacterales bacterium]
MKILELLLLIAGALHFAILIASALVPHVLDWRRNLAGLHPFLRRLFWVYGVFIVLMIVGFGTLTLLNAGAMAEGQPVARSLCGFIAIFWLARLGVQIFVFDSRPFLTTAFLTIGYHLLTLVFLYLVIVYGWAALAPIL